MEREATFIMVNETASGNIPGYWSAVVYTIKLFIESPNHRTVWAERDLCRSFRQDPCSEKVQLDHVAHGIVQLSLNSFSCQQWRFHKFSGQSVPQGRILSLYQIWISCVSTSAYCILSFHCALLRWVPLWNHVECLAKIKVSGSHCSTSVQRAHHLVTEGNEIGQVWFAL